MLSLTAVTVTVLDRWHECEGSELSMYNRSELVALAVNAVVISLNSNSNSVCRRFRLWLERLNGNI